MVKVGQVWKCDIGGTFWRVVNADNGTAEFPVDLVEVDADDNRIHAPNAHVVAILCNKDAEGSWEADMRGHTLVRDVEAERAA
jgi:hypothetical protein